MPELPEVETCRAGIAPHISGKAFQRIIIREPRLRWPVPLQIAELLPGLTLHRVDRRGKYLILHTEPGCLLLHLGMSGNLRITSQEQPLAKHDHIDFVFNDGTVLRFNDQRRFGAVLWTTEPLATHALLNKLGPEPLSAEFNGEYLYQQARKRGIAVKTFIMNSHIVVGVGNIYANEALFMAGIHPLRAANQLSQAECETLAISIKTILEQAIKQGGTTLRDFLNAQGKPGYFQQKLQVYSHAAEPCPKCGQPIEQIKIAQRSSFFCARCQLQ